MLVGKVFAKHTNFGRKAFEIVQQFETPKWEGKMDSKMVPGWTLQNRAQKMAPKKKFVFFTEKKFKHIQIVAPHATPNVSSVKIRFP